MRFYSFCRKGIDLEEVEIEISLMPGLPMFHITGLPDASIRESLIRIKSALRHQEFILPTKDQVLIHLSPSFEKKSSQGLDLAIAAAYLIKTGQIQMTEAKDTKIYFYGELGLEGDVKSPADIELLEDTPESSLLITGPSERPLDLFHGQIRNLKDLTEIRWLEPQFDSPAAIVKSNSEAEVHSHLEHMKFSKSYAELLTTVAVGEHNSFVAGPAGTGKTTLSRALHRVLRPPTQAEQKKINKISRIARRSFCKRPYVAPHHSASDIALLGGGVPPQPGEVTRAQFGVLVLDEYLEFKHHVKESLREPIESHEITVCRTAGRVAFPADFLLVGTSNLCQCGEYVPNRPTKCGYSSTRCKSYLQRLSGPMLDRFEIVAFSHQWKNKKGEESVSLAQIRQQVLEAQKFAKDSRGQVKMNSRLSLNECESLIDPFTRMNLMPELPESHRRLMALLRVARSLADMAESDKIQAQHIEQARLLTVKPFLDLKEAVR